MEKVREMIKENKSLSGFFIGENIAIKNIIIEV